MLMVLIKGDGMMMIMINVKVKYLIEVVPWCHEYQCCRNYDDEYDNNSDEDDEDSFDDDDDGKGSHQWKNLGFYGHFP